ncbi:hypothetical protein GGF32_006744 [Allomyces javanicus]|nr:hypothetical protein GGF32_006744 [Allomyces javanicus]
MVSRLPALKLLESFELVAGDINPWAAYGVMKSLRTCPMLRIVRIRVVSMREPVDLEAIPDLEEMIPKDLDSLDSTWHFVQDGLHPLYKPPFTLKLTPVKRDLTVLLPLWQADTVRALPLAKGLTRLSLSRGDDPAVLRDLFPRLPTTLTTLNLESWPLHGHGAMTLLARHMPPRLQSLTLVDCQLERTDLAAIAAWPRSLTHLRLPFNRIDALPVPLPPRLREFNLVFNPLKQEECAWIVDLPRSLRHLELPSTTNAEAWAPWLLALLPRNSPHEKIMLGMDVSTLSKQMQERLREAFILWNPEN